MFCYNEKCNGQHDNCDKVQNIGSLTLKFNAFISEDDIEMGKDILCLVTSWEEPPYFIVLNKHIKGMCNALDGMKLENTRILKWAYLPECEVKYGYNACIDDILGGVK